MANSGWTNDQPLSLTIGTIPGQHSIINNPATGDPVDVYDVNNNLIFTINAFGEAVSIDPTFQLESSLTGGFVQIDNFLTGQAVKGVISLNPAVDAHHRTIFALQAIPNTANQQYSLQITAGSDDGAFPPTLFGTERGVGGSIVQSDQVSANNLMRLIPHRNFTTDAGGVTTVTHGARFTPNEAFVQETGSTGSASLTFVVIEGSFTSTQFQVKVFLNGAAFTSDNYDATMLCFG